MIYKAAMFAYLSVGCVVYGLCSKEVRAVCYPIDPKALCLGSYSNVKWYGLVRTVWFLSLGYGHLENG